MALLDTWLGTDQFDVLETKTNDTISKVNDIKENLETLTAGMVPRQIDATDFNFEGVFVPTLATGEAAKEKKRIQTGDWNMSVDGTLEISHGLNSTQWKTLVVIGIIVRNDADDTYYSLMRVGTGGNIAGGVTNFNSTSINISRVDGDTFDGGNFNATSYNRGYIDIEYIP